MATEFTEMVWELLRKIPRGRVTTYKEMAIAIGKPNAARAVGNACNKNPFAPKTPCHRVVESNGRIGGYNMGIGKKTALLKKEGIAVKNGRIVNFDALVFRFMKKKECLLTKKPY